MLRKKKKDQRLRVTWEMLRLPQHFTFVLLGRERERERKDVQTCLETKHSKVKNLLT